MTVKISSAIGATGVIIPKSDFRAVPARGAPKAHLDRYGVSYWSAADEPLKYATVKKVFDWFDTTGVLERLDQLCFMALNEAGSLLNWVSLGIAPTNQGMPFGSLGFEGDGVSAHINTNFNPSSGSPNYKLETAHFGVYISDNAGAQNASNVAFGHTGSPMKTVLYPMSTAANSAYRLNGDATVSFSGNPYHGQPGFMLVNRTSANLTRFLHNGNLVHSNPADPATSLANSNFCVARRESSYGGGKYAGWSIGDRMLASANQNQEQVLSQGMLLLGRAMLAP
jgi:hypothetical protein